MLNMNQYKIFISGVQKELKEERLAIKDFILKNFILRDHFNVFLFEDQPAKGKAAEHTYLTQVKACDIYIGILGNKYGESINGKLSPTEIEFREAKKQHKEILIFINGENGSNDQKRDPGVQKLIKEIKDPRNGYSYKRFKTNFELTDCVFESLAVFLKDRKVIGRGEFDQHICDGARFSDIDEKRVKWFLHVAKERRNFPLNLKASTKEVFTHLKLLRDGKLTNAAVLLFGKDPRKFFDQAKIKCIYIRSMEVEKPFASYHIYEGNLFEQVDKAVDFVLDSIKFALYQQEHTAQARRVREIPVFAVQEAIVNAVAHRDYNTTSSVQVMVFLDRVEVWNSGSLPPNLSVGDLKKPHASHPKNPSLATVLYFADYIQQAGSGTIEMIKQCKAQGLAEPDFISIKNLEFKTILARDIFTDNLLHQIGLTEKQLKAVQYVKEQGQITNQVYQQINKVAKRTASRDLLKLVSLKVFKKSGITGKGTVYALRGHKGAKGAIEEQELKGS